VPEWLKGGKPPPLIGAEPWPSAPVDINCQAWMRLLSERSALSLGFHSWTVKSNNRLVIELRVPQGEATIQPPPQPTS